jgi:hypothetical protein
VASLVGSLWLLGILTGKWPRYPNAMRAVDCQSSSVFQKPNLWSVTFHDCLITSDTQAQVQQWYDKNWAWPFASLPRPKPNLPQWQLGFITIFAEKHIEYPPASLLMAHFTYPPQDTSYTGIIVEVQYIVSWQ